MFAELDRDSTPPESNSGGVLVAAWVTMAAAVLGFIAAAIFLYVLITLEMVFSGMSFWAVSAMLIGLLNFLVARQVARSRLSGNRLLIPVVSSLALIGTMLIGMAVS